MSNIKIDHQKESSPPYVGRFAPSPTGPLHLGSLVAAVASYLDAKANDGRWLLRIEDVDETRNQSGAAADIVATLARFGFEWDDQLLVQSDRYHRYRSVLNDLINAGDVYPCSCSRKQVALDGRRGLEGFIYTGRCRKGIAKQHSAVSWRFRVDNGEVEFTDLIQGQFKQDVANDVGDFVLLRADGCWAYQLAVVVDDADYGVTHVVRGSDLLDSTARQILLQKKLNFPSVAYAHFPVIENHQGEKLSKQTKAKPLLVGNEVEQLFFALDFLGQAPPKELFSASLNALWSWAHEAWCLAHIPQKRGISVTLEHKNEYKILL